MRNHVGIAIIVLVVAIAALVLADRSRSPDTQGIFVGAATTINMGVSCQDTDGGNNENVAGTVTYRRLFGRYSGRVGADYQRFLRDAIAGRPVTGGNARMSNQIYTDSCASANTLTEYSCVRYANWHYVSTPVTCRNGCENGACRAGGTGSLVRGRFTGSISAVNLPGTLATPLRARIPLGAHVELTATYMREAADTDPGPAGVFMLTTDPSELDIRVSPEAGAGILTAFRTASESPMIIAVRNEQTDSITITAPGEFAVDEVLGAEFAGIAVGPLTLTLRDPSGNALGSSNLPSSLDQRWAEQTLTLTFTTASGQTLGSATANFAGSNTVCTDSDGRNYNFRGYACSQGLGVGCGLDVCSLGKLYERICTPAGSAFEVVTCPNGCVNGACRDDTLTGQTYEGTCTDQDNGLHPEIGSGVCLQTPYSGRGCAADFCTNANTLAEGVCTRYGNEWQMVSCPNGCDALARTCKS